MSGHWCVHFARGLKASKTPRLSENVSHVWKIHVQHSVRSVKIYTRMMEFLYIYIYILQVAVLSKRKNIVCPRRAKRRRHPARASQLLFVNAGCERSACFTAGYVIRHACKAHKLICFAEHPPSLRRPLFLAHALAHAPATRFPPSSSRVYDYVFFRALFRRNESIRRLSRSSRGNHRFAIKDTT